MWGASGMISVENRAIQGVILAGGKGTRLQPLTNENNKQLLRVGDKPLVFYAIDQLVRADVRDIFMVIDERHGSQFMAAIRDGRHLGVERLAYIWQPAEGHGLPTAINRVEGFVRDKFVVACGDVIIEEGITPAVEKFREQRDGARVVATYQEDSAGYSPLEVVDDRVVQIHSKDKGRHIPALIDLGCYLYTREVFDRIAALTPSARGETEIWDLNKTYVDEGTFHCTQVGGWWSDVGTSLETYCEAHNRYS